MPLLARGVGHGDAGLLLSFQDVDDLFVNRRGPLDSPTHQWVGQQGYLLRAEWFVCAAEPTDDKVVKRRQVRAKVRAADPTAKVVK